MTKSGSISRRKLLIGAVAACVAGGIQSYRVIQGEGGSLAAVSIVCFFIVLVLSVWQLYTGAATSNPNRL